MNIYRRVDRNENRGTETEKWKRYSDVYRQMNRQR